MIRKFYQIDYDTIGGNPYYGEGIVIREPLKKKEHSIFDILFKHYEISNVLNPSNEIEPTEISFEVKKLIDDYILDVKTKEVNYNLYLQSKPKLIIKYLEELNYAAEPKRSFVAEFVVLFIHEDIENFINLELFIDILNLKCYLCNTKPANIGYRKGEI
jgi:secreted Zn-dependent insulinase-like peptidase